MKKNKILILTTILLLLITGCKENNNKNIDPVKNTSITEGNVKSYRMKVSIKSKTFKDNYIVFNDNNKKYEISTQKNGNNITIKINNGKTEVLDSEGNEYKMEVKTDYTKTDLYLNGINLMDSKIDSNELKIGKEKYTKYNFQISKEKFNEMMKPFSITANTNGNGYTYIDNNNHVYLINYNIDGYNVNISYTNIEAKKSK